MHISAPQYQELATICFTNDLIHQYGNKKLLIPHLTDRCIRVYYRVPPKGAPFNERDYPYWNHGQK